MRLGNLSNEFDFSRLLRWYEKGASDQLVSEIIMSAISSGYSVFRDIWMFLFKNLEMVIYYVWSHFTGFREGYD